MAGKMDTWSIADFLGHFENEIDAAVEERFKDQFKALAGELELLDTEFMDKKRGCGGSIEKILDSLHSIAGRVRYCEAPRGFEKDCDVLYGDVSKAVDLVRDFRAGCSA